jgi:thioredoxin 1
MIDELSTANFGSVKVAKVNIDDNPKAPSRYGVTSIPTLMVFKGGQVVETFIGAQPKQRLQDALNRHIDVEMA